MYNLIIYSDNYSKTWGSLYKFCRDEPKNPVIDCESFKFKSRFLNNTNNDGIMNTEITLPLINLSNFWRTLGMP